MLHCKKTAMQKYGYNIYDQTSNALLPLYYLYLKMYILTYSPPHMKSLEDIMKSYFYIICSKANRKLHVFS